MCGENFKEESLIYLRLVIDRIHVPKGPLNIPIIKEMLDFVHFAWLLYREALEKEKIAYDRLEKKNDVKKRARKEFGELLTKRVALRMQMRTN